MDWFLTASDELDRSRTELRKSERKQAFFRQNNIETLQRKQKTKPRTKNAALTSVRQNNLLALVINHRIAVFVVDAVEFAQHRFTGRCLRASITSVSPRCVDRPQTIGSCGEKNGRIGRLRVVCGKERHWRRFCCRLCSWTHNNGNRLRKQKRRSQNRKHFCKNWKFSV